MKKLLIILAFLPSIVFGQVGQWDTTDGILYPTDSTLKIPLSATDTIYGIDVDTNLVGINYISRLSKIKLIYDFDGDATDDTVSANRLFQNFDFDSLFYCRIENKTLNTNNTINLPQRITEIEVYSTATDRVSYFNVPNVGDINVPNDYATITLAVSAATTGQVIDIESGTYLEGNFLDVQKAITLRGIGDVTITNNASQTQTIQLFYDNITLENVKVESNSSTYAVYCRLNVVVKNCEILGGSTHQVFMRGVDTGDTVKLYNSIVTGINAASYPIRTQTCQHIINENYIEGVGTHAIRDFTLTENEFSKTVTYNILPRCENWTSGYPIGVGTRYNAINYNRVTASLMNGIMFDLTTITTLKYLTLKGNYYMTKNVSTSSYGFLRPGRLYQYIIEDNYVKIDSSNCTAINIFIINPISIKNNTFDIYQGTNLFIKPNVNEDTVTINIENNNFYQHYSPDNGSNYNINFNYIDSSLRVFPITIVGNNFRNPYYYGSVGGGHTCIYLGNIRTKDIHHNYFTGVGIAAIIDKGENGTTSGSENLNSYIWGNYFDSCGIILKGVRNDSVLNNTFQNSPVTCVRIFTNQDNASNEDAANNTLINNIFEVQTIDQRYPYSVELPVDTVGFYSSKNVLWGKDSIYMANNARTIAQVESFGYNIDSYNTNPNLNVNGVPQRPSNAIGNGVNLGTPYNVGLVPNTTLPNPSTTNQKALWTIGAYVTDLNRIVTFKVKVIPYNGKIIIFK